MKKERFGVETEPYKLFRKKRVYNVCRGRVPSRPENFILLQLFFLWKKLYVAKKGSVSNCLKAAHKIGAYDRFCIWKNLLWRNICGKIWKKAFRKGE